MRALRITGKVIAWILLAAVLLVSLTLLGGIVAARTDWGHRKLLARVLPLIDGAIDGKLTIGKIGGTLTGALEVDDVELTDREGQTIARLRRLTATYNLAALWNHTIDLHRVDADGLWVRLRYLADGRLNVAALAKPSPPGPASSGAALKVHVDILHLSAEARYEPRHPSARDAAQSHATLQLTGGATIDGNGADIRVDELTVQGQDPAVSQVEVKGRAYIDGTLATTVDGVLRVAVDGTQVDRLIPPEWARLTGALVAELHVAGPLRQLIVRLAVTLPRGTLASDGTVGVMADGATWRGTVRARDIDPGRVYAGLPHGRLQFDGGGAGHNGHGRIERARVDLAVAGLRARVSGEGNLDGTGAVVLAFDADDLSRLRGLAPLDKLRLGGALRLDGRITRSSQQLAFDVDARARNLTIAGQRFEWLALHAAERRGVVRLSATGQGPRETDFAVAVHGAAIGTTGADLTLDHVRLTRVDQTIQTLGPAHIRIDHGITVEHLRLATTPLQWQEGARHLELGALTLAVDGKIAAGRAAGALAISGTGVDIRARVDLPLAPAPHSPFSADVTVAQLPIELLAPLLPPRLAALEGKLDTALHARGTLRTPELDASFDLPWNLGDLRENYTNMKVSYRRNQLALEQQTTLAGKSAGTIALTLATSIDAGRVLSAPRRDRAALARDATVQARLDIDGMDLVKLDLPYFGIDPPLSEGVLTAHVTLDGPLRDPKLQATVGAKGLARPGVVDHLDLNSQLRYQKGTADLQADASLLGGKLLELQANAALDLPAIAAGAPWRDTRIHAQATLPAFDLARLKKMQRQLDTLQGALTVHATVDGTLTRPTARLDATATQLRVAALTFPTLTAVAALQNGVIAAQLDAAQEHGGKIHGAATLPLDAAQDLAVDLHAQGLDLGFLPGVIPQLRKVQGALVADFTLRGSRAHPLPAGRVQLGNGAFQLAGDSHVYDHIALDAGVQGGQLTLTQLAVHSGDGWLKATGSGQLDGLVPTRFSVDGNARRFLIALGANAAWLDADIAVRGTNAGAQTNVRVDVNNGLVSLPKIEAGQQLQSTDELSHVRYDDQQARREERVQQRASTTEIVAHVPGPFKVKSKEANIDLKGDLDVTITGSEIRINGNVETDDGWVELLGRRYELERVGVSFTGAPANPALDIRLTRQFSDAAIIVEVHGTGKHPKLVLSSDPPIYDESEILGILLTGDPASQRTSDKSLDSKVVGAISGLVVGKLKDLLVPALPVDVIKVDSGGEEYGGLMQTRVEIGKFITENIYLSYVHQFGPPPGLQVTNSNEAHVEYRFKRRYEIDTSYGDNGVGGIDLFWTLRY